MVGACHSGKPQTRWWTLEVNGAIKVKKENQAWLANGTLEAADGYWQAKQNATLCKAKIQVWDEFGQGHCGRCTDRRRRKDFYIDSN